MTNKKNDLSHLPGYRRSNLTIANLLARYNPQKMGGWGPLTSFALTSGVPELERGDLLRWPRWALQKLFFPLGNDEQRYNSEYVVIGLYNAQKDFRHAGVYLINRGFIRELNEHKHGINGADVVAGQDGAQPEAVGDLTAEGSVDEPVPAGGKDETEDPKKDRKTLVAEKEA